jgi:hypothetical protein
MKASLYNTSLVSCPFNYLTSENLLKGLSTYDVRDNPTSCRNGGQKGGLFDLDATLPLMAIQFLILVLLLNATFTSHSAKHLMSVMSTFVQIN